MLGGLCTTYLSWHWIFLVNVPLGAVALGAALALVPRGLQRTPGALDVPGAVQLFPDDRALWDLRHKLSLLSPDSHTRQRATDPRPFRDLLFRRLAFANLIRFSGPVSLPFIHEIARHRTSGFGSFCVEALELVQTDRLFSADGTTTIDRMALGR